MNEKLMKAILALDSYNRGYDEGIKIVDSNLVVGSTLGNYTIIQQSDYQTDTDGVDAGFYTIAYQNTASGARMIPAAEWMTGMARTAA